LWTGRCFVNRVDEPVAATGQRLDEAGVIGGIAERVAQPGDGGVEHVVEIDEHVARPQPPAQFLARDHLARPLEQCEEHRERLVAQAHGRPTP
jgi:hypothetical protein